MHSDRERSWNASMLSLARAITNLVALPMHALPFPDLARSPIRKAAASFARRPVRSLPLLLLVFVPLALRLGVPAGHIEDAAVL